MKKCAIIYGSTTGTCEQIAGKIADRLGIPASAVYSAADLTQQTIDANEVLILGSSTWGDGELQDDWYTALETLKASDLASKSVALFGCGDAESYGDTYCDAMGTLYNELKGSGCRFIGTGVPADGYAFSSSTALIDGAFVGLALDDVNQSGLTDERIERWADKIAGEL